MSGVRLALLNPSTSTEETRRNFDRELDAELVHFDVQAGEVPETFAFDGCVITGSAASVYSEDPWLPPMTSWIADALEAGIPFLGVCYGHQLLADVLGGTVESMGEYELGYRTIRHSGDSPLLEGIDEEFVVFTSHQDRVTELPPGARTFAENEFGIHGFRRGSVFGVQFHPEYDKQTASNVAGEKDIPPDQKEAVLAAITDENYAAACQAKQLFDNFIDYVATTRISHTAAD